MTRCACRIFCSEAYRRCRIQGGSPGVDGVSFDQIENEGVDKFLAGIADELLNDKYRPQAVKRVYVPKANGKQRPLGIPVIKDRVVQQSCKIVIEPDISPVLEADFEDESYGFRPGRGTHDAVKKIGENLKAGLTEVYDPDLSAYFDTIPHKELLQLVGRRISDKKIRRLLRMWLKAPVSEDGQRSDLTMSGGRKNKTGTLFR